MDKSVEQLVWYETQNRILDELTVRRALTEVDHLNRLRNPDGSHDPRVLDGVLENLIPAVKEAGIPHAVSTTYQEYRNGEFYWLDMTAEEAAASGRKFHAHPAALARVDVEVDEARSFKDLQPGMAKVFLSPRMSRADASYEIAQDEHLADDDMIRIHALDSEEGVIKGKFMQSSLVRHIPLDAWIAMLKDPNNIFGKSITVEDEDSALAVMQTHRELSVPLEKLPEGVVSIIEAVLPYLDKRAQESVRMQLLLLRDDQETIHQKSQSIALRWRSFEVELADSLSAGFATPQIRQFIVGLMPELSNEIVQRIKDQTDMYGRLVMTRELAAIVERLRRNMLWTSAAVVSGNQRVIDQLGEAAYQRIYTDELFIQQMMQEGATGHEITAIESGMNAQIAQANVKVGGGCPGILDGLFKSKEAESAKSHETEVLRCVKCPLCGKEGVDAKITHSEKEKKITCLSCKQSKIYKK